MGDKELIDALRNGRNTAWAELVERYLKLVCFVVRKTLATYGRDTTGHDVEDISHDLFESLVKDNYRVLGTIREPYDLKAWLAISARRRAIDFVRRKRVAPVSLDDGAVLRSSLASPEESAEPAGRAEDHTAVQESLGILSARERLVVQLFYLDGKKYREISRITGINANSISPTLMRAVEKMQRYLTDRNSLSTET